MSNTPIEKPQTQTQGTGKGSLLTRLIDKMEVEKDRFSSSLPYILVSVGLVILYIANAHYHVKTLRNIKDTQKELKELQAEYVSLKAELAKKTKASELAKSLEETNIKELRTPPFIIKEKED